MEVKKDTKKHAVLVQPPMYRRFNPKEFEGSWNDFHESFLPSSSASYTAHSSSGNPNDSLLHSGQPKDAESNTSTAGPDSDNSRDTTPPAPVKANNPRVEGFAYFLDSPFSYAESRFLEYPTLSDSLKRSGSVPRPVVPLPSTSTARAVSLRRTKSEGAGVEDPYSTQDTRSKPTEYPQPIGSTADSSPEVKGTPPAQVLRSIDISKLTVGCCFLFHHAPLGYMLFPEYCPLRSSFLNNPKCQLLVPPGESLNEVPENQC